MESSSRTNKSSKFPSSFQGWMNIASNKSSRYQTVSLAQCLDAQAHVKEFWGQKTRPDGRLFTQGRATQVVFGMLKHSAGSALVSQKDGEGRSTGTKILAATTFNIGQPSPEQPEEGEVVVQVSGTGGRNFGADSKSQQHRWDTLQSWLQRILEEDECIAQSLNLLTGKASLRLVVTLIVLEDNGNIKDGALLACMAAWKDTRLPKVGKDLIEVQGRLWWKRATDPIISLVEETPVVVHEGFEKKNGGDRNKSDYRISLTMGIWIHPREGTAFLLADPSGLEEPCLDGTITVIVSLATKNLQVDYTGKVPLAASDMALATRLAYARAKEVTSILL